MRPGLIALLLCLPSPALAQATGSLPWRVVTVASQPEAPSVRAPRRFSATVSLGPAFSRIGFSAGDAGGGLAGLAAMISVRAAVWLGTSVAVQVGGLGVLALDPSSSVAGTAGAFQLERPASFGLVGAGVVIGGRWSGLRLSVLGGVAFVWAPLDGPRARATLNGGAGGGAVVELARHWAIGDAWSIGLGATAWALAGADDIGWLAPDTVSHQWNVLGGGLVASVATR